MPDVSTTLARLREAAADDFIHQKPYVPLADAVSAVEEAFAAGRAAAHPDRDEDGTRLYNLLALWDTRDGSPLADLVRSAREGFERSHPDMAEADAWQEFDALWARSSSAERLRWAKGAAAHPDPPDDDDPADEEFTEAAWGLIANAYGGNWNDAPDEWHGAACRWRDEYTAGVTARIPAASPDPPDDAGQDFTAWFTTYPKTHRLRGRTVEVVPREMYDRLAAASTDEDADAPHQREPGEAPDTPGTCRAPHCWSEYGTPCANCPEEKR